MLLVLGVGERRTEERLVEGYIDNMKGTEVPNPQQSSACGCTCCLAHSVLFLPMQSLLKGFRLSQIFNLHPPERAVVQIIM